MGDMNMSPKEQAIADAALRAYPASDYVELLSQIAEVTGFAVDEAEEILTDLTGDKTLIERIEPISNPTP
jgi:hypothetical protein